MTPGPAQVPAKLIPGAYWRTNTTGSHLILCRDGKPYLAILRVWEDLTNEEISQRMVEEEAKYLLN